MSVRKQHGKMTCIKCKIQKDECEFEMIRNRSGVLIDDTTCAECRETIQHRGSYTSGAAFIEGLKKNLDGRISERDRYLSGKSTWGDELKCFTD